VWVPDLHADLSTLDTPEYGWIAFTRRQENAVVVTAPPATETVDVVLFLADLEASPENTKGRVEKGDGVKVVGPLTYPASEWGVPIGDKAREALKAALGDKAQIRWVFGTATDDSRRPLALARAALLAFEFNGSDHDLPGAYVLAEPSDRERIVLVYRQG
jgi:hypothetical protein